MSTEHIDFITNNFNPELSKILIRAIHIFDTYNLENYELTLNNLIYGKGDHKDLDDFKDEYVNIIKELLIELGKQFTFIFNENATIEDVVSLFEYLINLEYYLDHEAVINVLDNVEHHIETLARLFNMIDNVSENWVFLTLDDFDSSLLNKIRESHTRVVIEPIETEKEQKDTDMMIDQLKLYRDFTSNDKLVCFKLIRRGVPIGQSFKHNVEYIRNHLEYAKDEDLAFELLGILMMSDDTYKNPVFGLKEHSNYLFDTLEKISKIDNLVNKIMSDLLNYKTNTKGKQNVT